MVYSGIINWGRVEATIKIYDVVITDGQLISAKAIIALNGQTKELTFSGSPIG